MNTKKYTEPLKTFFQVAFCLSTMFILICFQLAPDPTRTYVSGATLLWDLGHLSYIVLCNIPSCLPIWLLVGIAFFGQILNSRRREPKRTKKDIIEELQKENKNLQVQLGVERAKVKHEKGDNSILKISVEIMKNGLCPECKEKLAAQVEFLKNMEK
jgi:hypothetical protein